MTQAVISLNKLNKVYQVAEMQTTVLANISLTINKGEFVAIMGPSGSGKSTLMHILGALDLPTSGQYFLDGQDVSLLNDDALAEIRNKKIGFVFQAYNLLARTSALDNVMVPMEYAGIPDKQQLERATDLLSLVGLEQRLYYPPNKLSGGQQQRVAIARALVMNPAIILADEPTGNIASDQAEEVMGIFEKLNQKGHTIIVITHEPDIAQYAQRVIHILDGKLIDPKTKTVLEQQN